MSKFKLGAWFHRAGKLLRGRTFTAAGLAVAVGLSLWAVAENVKILYIADGAETGVTLALRSDPTEQALSRAGITLKENDTVTTRETALVYSRVSISRGVSVTLVADGRETPCTVTGGTVAELLEQNIRQVSCDTLNEQPAQPLIELVEYAAHKRSPPVG